MSRVAESGQRVWIVLASPAIWAGHLLVSYATAALWCGRIAGALGDPGPARLAIGAYTAAALGGIAVVGWWGRRAQTIGAQGPPYDSDSPEDRHRFLGFATWLLSALSAVAVVYAALVALMVDTCQ